MPKNEDREIWEDCCDNCAEQVECDILVARCEMVKGKPCDKCLTCDDFRAISPFTRMDTIAKVKK